MKRFMVALVRVFQVAHHLPAVQMLRLATVAQQARANLTGGNFSTLCTILKQQMRPC